MKKKKIKRHNPNKYSLEKATSDDFERFEFGYNKMIISSSRLIVVSLSLLSTIVLISSSFTKIFTGFRETTKGYDMTVMRVRENATKYDKLVSIDGINEVKYLYYYFDEHTTYNDNK